MLRPEDFFELDQFYYKALFGNAGFVWEALGKLKSYLKEVLSPNVTRVRKGGVMVPKTCLLLDGEVIDAGFEIVPGEAAKGELKVYRAGEELKEAAVLYAGAILFDDAISIGEGAVIEPGALIKGPALIGRNTELRQGAYIRGNCLIGDRCVVGHATEMKSAVMLPEAKAGHFAYIGDSILGNKVNLGAGTKLANLKIIAAGVDVRVNRKKYNTGLKKFGAVLGDEVETGCNSVTNPGTLLGKASLVYPNITVPGGYYPSYSMISPLKKGAVSVRPYQRR